MNSREFNQMIFQAVESMIRQKSGVKMGKVVAVSSGRPRVLIDGEKQASEKFYKRFSWYTPKVGDRVAMLKINSTFVVLGALV